MVVDSPSAWNHVTLHDILEVVLKDEDRRPNLTVAAQGHVDEDEAYCNKAAQRKQV